MRHGEMLAPGIEHVLAEAGIAVAELTGIAVGRRSGPVHRSPRRSRDGPDARPRPPLPVHGVCSLDILAAEAIDAGLSEFLVATDARRKEVYVASYAAGRRVHGPEVLRPEDAATAGPVVGRGATLYPDDFPHAAAPEHPSAAVLCDVVTRQRFEILDPEPLYLRRPDAAVPGKPKRVS